MKNVSGSDADSGSRAKAFTALPSGDAQFTTTALRAGVIAPSPDEDRIFSIDIESFIRKAAEIAGYTQLPAILNEASGDVSQADPAGYLTEDPEMYAAVMSLQVEERQLVEQALLIEMRRMLDQLMRLELRDRGGLDDYLKTLRRAIRAADED